LQSISSPQKITEKRKLLQICRSTEIFLTFLLTYSFVATLFRLQSLPLPVFGCHFVSLTKMWPIKFAKMAGKQHGKNERRRQDNWLFDSIGKSNVALRLSDSDSDIDCSIWMDVLTAWLTAWLPLWLIARASKEIEMEMETNVRSTKNLLQILIRSTNNKQAKSKKSKRQMAKGKRERKVQ